ncbi:hypothetical protein Tco_1106545 [Tanacetum coccineum]
MMTKRQRLGHRSAILSSDFLKSSLVVTLAGAGSTDCSVPSMKEMANCLIVWNMDQAIFTITVEQIRKPNTGDANLNETMVMNTFMQYVGMQFKKVYGEAEGTNAKRNLTRRKRLLLIGGASIANALLLGTPFEALAETGEAEPRMHGNVAGMPYAALETRGNAGETFLQLWYADPYLGNVWGNVSGPKSHVSYAWFKMLAFDLEEEIIMQVGGRGMEIEKEEDE